MKGNATSIKLVKEIIRLRGDLGVSNCSVPMLISALYAVRDDESDYTNLFFTYIDKVQKVKSVDVDKSTDELVTSTDSKEQEGDANSSKYVFEGILDGEITKVEIEGISDELKLVFDRLESFVKENNIDEVVPEYFVIALFDVNSKTLRTFLKKISVNYMDMESFFKKDKILGYQIVPYQLCQFVKYANPLYKDKECDIIGREDVLKEIYRIMLKSSKRNVIAYGNAGVGKTSVGEKFMYEIANNLCPERFRGFKVLEMSVKDFILSCEDGYQANEKMNQLLEFLSGKKDIILFIDEIQAILGKGGLFDQKKLDLSTTLKPILARGDIRILGLTTTIDFNGSFRSDPTLERRFEGVEIEEIKYKDVHRVIEPRVRKKELEKGIKISNDLIDDAIWYAACFEFFKCNPDKSIDVIDRAMANAQLNNRDEVVKQDIIDVFNISFKRWNGMEPTVKRNTAYHEAGHYVLNTLTNTRNFKVLAVSIYPTDDYMGVNVLEYDEEVTPVTNRKYFLDMIASDLAGRVAEELIGEDINAGASTDLDNATSTAQSMIMDYGLGQSGIAKNRVFLSEGLLGLGSDDTAKEVEEEVDQIIEIGYNYAKKMLIANRDYLDAIANALLERQILRKDELDAIWNEVSAKRIERGVQTGCIGPEDSPKKKNDLKYKLKKVARKSTRDLRRKIRKILK